MYFVLFVFITLCSSKVPTPFQYSFLIQFHPLIRVCPVFWLTMWLAESRITSGPIFQPLSKDGSSVKPSVEAGGDRLTPKQYVNMLNVLLEKCKLYVPGHKPWVNVIERTSCCDACKSTFKDGVGNVTWVKASGLTTHSFSIDPPYTPPVFFYSLPTTT